MAGRSCKKAGSYRVCQFHDYGNERRSIVIRRYGTMSTEGEAYQFWFDEAKDARSWYKGIHGRTDVEDLVRAAGHGGIEMQELEKE